MFKNLKAKFGSGGAKVETILDNETVQPGGTITGRVEVRGGEVEQNLRGIRVGLSAIVEVEGEDSEWESSTTFNEIEVSGPLDVGPGSQQDVPFQITVPVEVPPNVAGGRNLGKIRLAVATILDIEKAVDAKDNDPIRVMALPAQEATLNAMESLGFSFKGADLEKGKVPGSTLGFYGEYEFGAHGTGFRFNEAELTFVTRATDLDVILEVDKKGGFFTEGHDAIRSFQLSHHDTDVNAIANRLRGVFDGI